MPTTRKRVAGPQEDDELRVRALRAGNVGPARSRAPAQEPREPGGLRVPAPASQSVSRAVRTVEQRSAVTGLRDHTPPEALQGPVTAALLSNVAQAVEGALDQQYSVRPPRQYAGTTNVAMKDGWPRYGPYGPPAAGRALGAPVERPTQQVDTPRRYDTRSQGHPPPGQGRPGPSVLQRLDGSRGPSAGSQGRVAKPLSVDSEGNRLRTLDARDLWKADFVVTRPAPSGVDEPLLVAETKSGRNARDPASTSGPSGPRLVDRQMSDMNDYAKSLMIQYPDRPMYAVAGQGYDYVGYEYRDLEATLRTPEEHMRHSEARTLGRLDPGLSDGQLDDEGRRIVEGIVEGIGRLRTR